MDICFSIVWLFLCFGCCCSEMVEICNSTTFQQCKFTVSSDSALEMRSELESSNSLLVNTKLNFPRGVNSSSGTILPYHWVMTHVDKRMDQSNFFISWPIDYSLITFGFLDSRTLKDVTLNISTVPSNCDVIIGDPATNCGIVSALLNASETGRTLDPHIAIYWCYISEYPGVRNETGFSLKMYFGIPIRMYGFRCCHKKRDSIFCNHVHSVKWNGYQILPCCAGIAFFCFFPIMLMKCSSIAMDSGRKVTSKMKQYEDLDFDKEKWIFLQKRPPITISGLFLGIFSLGTKHPVATSRIRRICFVFGTPIVIYVKIYMYYQGWPEFVKEVAKAKLPFGFASIAGGIYDSRFAFVPKLGGPFVSLILYFVVGVLVLAIPRDFGEALEKGISSSSHAQWTLLRLDIITIEELSYKSCINHRGYHKVFALLKASVCMVINPQFWRFVIQFLIKRWRVSMYPLCKTVSTIKCVRWSICIFLLSLYILLSVMETILAVIYYAIPINQFLIVISKGYRAYINEQIVDRHVTLKICLSVLCTFSSLFYLYLASLIIFESFCFVSKVIFFLYLSVVIFPNNSFSFVYSFLMLLFFIHRICSEVETDYHDILYETIEAVNHIKASNSKQEKITDSVMEREMYVVGASSTYVSDFNTESRHLPGIRRDLFDYVVRKYRPVHVAVFIAIVQICVMTFLVISSNLFVSHYVTPMKTDGHHEIIHVMSILLITILPNLVYSCFTPKVNHKVRKLKLRQTIVDFFRIEI